MYVPGPSWTILSGLPGWTTLHYVRISIDHPDRMVQVRTCGSTFLQLITDHAHLGPPFPTPVSESSVVAKGVKPGGFPGIQTQHHLSSVPHPTLKPMGIHTGGATERTVRTTRTRRGLRLGAGRSTSAAKAKDGIALSRLLAQFPNNKASPKRA